MRLLRDPAKISSGCKRGYLPPCHEFSDVDLRGSSRGAPAPTWPPCPASLGFCIRQSPPYWGRLLLRAWPYPWSKPGVLCPQDGQQLASRTSVSVPDSSTSGRRGRGNNLPTRSTFPQRVSVSARQGVGKNAGLEATWTPIEPQLHHSLAG